MDYLRILVYKFVRMTMRLLCLFPIKRNRIFFESYKGRSYSCNPKYICEEIIKKCGNSYDLIWVMRNVNDGELPAGVKIIKKGSLLNFYYHMTSRMIITNMTDDVFIPKRKNQIIINTWHAGGAYKRVGQSYKNTASRLTAWQNGIVRDETSYYVSSSELFTKYNIQEAYGYYGKVINAGMPRNDLFFDSVKMQMAKEKIRDLYSLQDQMIVLYAPTFRGDFGHADQQKYELPYKEIIDSFREQGSEVIILKRAHYAFSSMKGDSSDTLIDVSGYPDMQELLATADILITDYSSCMWDFALMKKPCILYIPDKDEYLEERGTYTSIEEWPGKVICSENDLIEELLHIDMDNYSNRAQKSLDYYGSYEKGTATQTIVDIIKKECS